MSEHDVVDPRRSAAMAVALSMSSPGWAAGLPEVAGSPIGYPTPVAALTALRSRPDVAFSDLQGWTPADHPAAPAVVRRQVLQRGREVVVRTGVLCGASKAAWDALVLDFAALLERQFPAAR